MEACVRKVVDRHGENCTASGDDLEELDDDDDEKEELDLSIGRGTVRGEAMVAADNQNHNLVPYITIIDVSRKTQGKSRWA